MAGNEILTAEEKAQSVALLSAFKPIQVLNQDQGSRRICLLGNARGQQGLLLIERAALPSELSTLEDLTSSFTDVANLGANDIYNWYMASISRPEVATQDHAPLNPSADLKINLIWPCQDSHIRKYSRQSGRMVTETAAIFTQYVRPYMVQKTLEGRLNWVYNIIEGRQEQQDIILRSSTSLGNDPEGFLLLPDMNWDRTTMANLRLIAIVERRDLLSMRDLRKKDVPWLKMMLAKLFQAVVEKYEGVEMDMLKAYVHYQPTYYHFHVHIVSVQLEPNATQAVGKAFSLPNLITQLECMAGDDDQGLMHGDVTYGIGENSEIWTTIFAPLKAGKTPVIASKRKREEADGKGK